jgi:hypothetical protein
MPQDTAPRIATAVQISTSRGLLRRTLAGLPTWASSRLAQNEPSRRRQPRKELAVVVRAPAHPLVTIGTMSICGRCTRSSLPRTCRSLGTTRVQPGVCGLSGLRTSLWLGPHAITDSSPPKPPGSSASRGLLGRTRESCGNATTTSNGILRSVQPVMPTPCWIVRRRFRPRRSPAYPSSRGTARRWSAQAATAPP